MKEHDLSVDETLYTRFSQRNTAFNVVSRSLGEDWHDRQEIRRKALVAEGKAALDETLDHPEDALLYHGLSRGFRAIRTLLGSDLGIASGRSLHLWQERSDTLPGATPRCTDAITLTTAARRVARACGAALVGMAPLDPRWLYAEVAFGSDETGEPAHKEVRVTEDGLPQETNEAFNLPSSLRFVIVIAVPMSRQMIRTAPSLLAEAATSMGYSEATRCAVSLARFIHAIGYRALPSLNDTGLTIPMAVQAGIGEQGRNGLLLSWDHGSCIRLAKVFTDMPLCVDNPTEPRIRSYCETCDECARHCPAQAISRGTPTVRGHNECNNDGVLKWYVNAQKCLRYWIAAGTSCSICIGRCPFTLGRAWWAGVPQWLTRRTRRFNRTLAWLDRRYGSRKRLGSSGYLRIPTR